MATIGICSTQWKGKIKYQAEGQEIRSMWMRTRSHKLSKPKYHIPSEDLWVHLGCKWDLEKQSSCVRMLTPLLPLKGGKQWQFKCTSRSCVWPTAGVNDDMGVINTDCIFTTSKSSPTQAPCFFLISSDCYFKLFPRSAQGAITTINKNQPDNKHIQ